MEIIPQTLTEITTKYGEALEEYYAQQMYERIIRSRPGHLLVLLKEEMDFQGLERACRGYHHRSGPGVRPTHGVQKMVRVLLLKYLYVLSYRETEEQMWVNLLFRWFAGYTPWENVPDHVTLQRFEEWVKREEAQVYFDEVLAQIYERHPQQREAEQMGDTYGMEANAGRQGRVEMWRALGKRVVGEMKAAGLEEALTGWDAAQLFGKSGEKPRWEMSEAEKWEQIVQTALGAQALVVRGKRVAGEENDALRQALAYLEKAVADEVEIEGERVMERKEKGTYRMGSATDPEASVRNHGKTGEKNGVMLGYNVQVAATVDGLITETQARTGATPDQEGVAELVSEQKARHGVTPPKMIYDAAAGSGKVRREVAEASDGQTVLSAPLPDYAGRSERFGPYDFELSADGEKLTCPAGKTSDIAYRSGSGKGRMFRFTWVHCWAEKPPGWTKNADLEKRCPLWEQCRGKGSGPRSQRHVFISDYRQEVEAAGEYNRTEAYRADRKKRPRIERVIAELVRYNGARRCRSRGLRSADWQAKMAAMAYNLKWWMRRVRQERGLSPP